MNCWHKDNEQANVTEAINNASSDTTLLLAHDDPSSQCDAWCLDSSVSNHMYGKRDLFVELIEGVRGNMDLGDLSKLPIEGKGKIEIYQKDGKKNISLMFVICQT